MKEIPILFSTPMVQAIQREVDPKSLTRRTTGLDFINQNPDDWQFEWADFALKKPWRFTQKSSCTEETLKDQSFTQWDCKCPYGQPGDVLWVRETFLIDEGFFYFKASYNNSDQEWLSGTWKPSIHMPKAAARIWLEVVSVKVARLKDISEQDAIAEGIETYTDETGRRFKDYTADSRGYGDPAHDYPTVGVAVTSFRTLWDKINGEESWNLNPWVWVVKFKKVENPNKK